MMSLLPFWIGGAFVVGVLFGTYFCKPAWRKLTETEKAVDDLIYRISFHKPLWPVPGYPQDVAFLAFLLNALYQNPNYKLHGEMPE